MYNTWDHFREDMVRLMQHVQQSARFVSVGKNFMLYHAEEKCQEIYIVP